MFKNIIKILSFIFFLSLNLFLNAQNFRPTQGLPYIRNYTPSEYNAHEQNFDIIQDNDGFMYFANFAGILKFNGVSWYKITSSSGMRLLSIAKNKNGRIFVGGLYDFGYLETNSKGKTHFFSLADSLNSEDKEFEAFGTHCNNNKVYFISKHKMFIYENEKISILNFKSKAESSFFINNELYIFFDKKSEDKIQNGLTVFSKNNFEKIEDNSIAQIVDVKTMFLSPFDNKIVIGTGSQGLFWLKNNKISEISSSINRYLKKYRLTCGIKISDGNYAFGTLTGGFAVADTKGNIIQIIDKKSNLQDETINALYIDKNKSVWVATNNGISKIELNAPLSYIDNINTGLYGKIIDIERFNDKIYFATNKGLFFLKDSIFVRNKTINTSCWSILSKNNKLFVATSKGVFIVSGNITKLSDIKEFTFCLGSSKHNKIYAGNSGKITILNLSKKGDVISTDEIPGFNADVMRIKEDFNENLFVEIPPGRIMFFNKKDRSLKLINSEDKIISFHLNKKNEHVFFTCEKGVFKYSESKNKLEEFNIFNDKTSHKLWIYDFYELSENKFITTNGEQKKIRLYTKNEDKIEENQTPFYSISDFAVNTIFFDKKNNNLWLGGTNKAIIYNLKKEKKYESDFVTEFTKITLLKSNKIIEIPENNDEILELNFSDNSISFEYAAAIYPTNGKMKFRYFLDGFEKSSSEFSTKSQKEYTNLPSGEYKFTVEAINEFGKTLKKTSIKILVLTPIYLKWWMFIIYGITFLLIGKLILNWRMKASQKEKEALEETVKERTEEIEIQKQQVEKQRDVAYHQRKEIIDSINYAQRIQQAVLSSSQYTNEELFEHFILFNPRDIVSGDFFWIKKLDNFIVIAAADCTGHGVPGAFMSMLGYSFLNEIVTRKTIHDSGQILSNLRSKIKDSMHWQGETNDQKDGMDIALYIIDTEKLEIQFSGAYNPLYIIREEDDDIEISKNIKIHKASELENIVQTSKKMIIELKADRQPIGIYIREKEFATIKYKLQKGDSLYTFSDGFVDQFGGETGGKFKVKNFKNLLLGIQDKTMEEQKYILERTMIKWRGDISQIDDILVIGLRI